MLSQAIDNYKRNLPENISDQAIRGALATSAVSIAHGDSAKKIIANASVSASTTIVEASIRPIFISYFGDGLIARVSSYLITAFLVKKVSDSTEYILPDHYKAVMVIGETVLNDFSKNQARAYII